MLYSLKESWWMFLNSHLLHPERPRWFWGDKRLAWTQRCTWTTGEKTGWCHRFAAAGFRRQDLQSCRLQECSGSSTCCFCNCVLEVILLLSRRSDSDAKACQETRRKRTHFFICKRPETNLVKWMEVEVFWLLVSSSGFIPPGDLTRCLAPCLVCYLPLGLQQRLGDASTNVFDESLSRSRIVTTQRCVASLKVFLSGMTLGNSVSISFR